MGRVNGQPVVINNNGCCAGSGCGFALLVGLLAVGWEALPLWADLLISLVVVAVAVLVVGYRVRPGLFSPFGRTSGVVPAARVAVLSQRPPTSADSGGTPITAATSEPSSDLASAEHLSSAPAANSASVLEALKGLAELRDAGVLTEAEFEAKKADLLSRL